MNLNLRDAKLDRAERTLIAVTLVLSTVWAACLIVAAALRTPPPHQAAVSAVTAGEPATRPSLWPVPLAADPGLPTPEQVRARLAAVKGTVDEK